MKKTSRLTCLFAAMILAVTAPAIALSAGMTMPMPEGPAHFKPTRQAYTTNHLFLVKLLEVPAVIPFEHYFKLRLAVYDNHHPKTKLTNADVVVFAGMRHGLKHGFAHGMQSAPKVESKDGVLTVNGMYFHMMGPWVVKVTVHQGNREGIAYLRLPCCGK